MANVNDFKSKTLRKSGDISDAFINFIELYLQDVNRLEYDEEPDYKKIQSKIIQTLKCLGHQRYTLDNFYIFKTECRNNLSRPILNSRVESHDEDLISPKKLVDIELIKVKV